METGFRHNFRRFGTTSTATVLTLVAALPVFPGSTTAQAADPVVSGSCAATVRGEQGRPLALDVDAAVNSPGRADVGLGSESDAALSLPVREAVNGLGLDDVGPVSGTAGAVCETGRTAVNGLSSAVGEALPGGGTGEPDPSDPQSGGSGAHDPNSPGSAPQPPPESPAAGGPAPSAASTPDSVHAGFGNSPEPQGGGAPPFAAGDRFAANGDRGVSRAPRDVAIPPAATVGPGADATAYTHNRQARAVHDTGTPPRLPLLLAVAALVLVAAALAHTWLRRATVSP